MSDSIRRFFNTAVIVDDELGERSKAESSGATLGGCELGPELTPGTEARQEFEAKPAWRADDLVSAFQEAGIVISPIPFKLERKEQETVDNHKARLSVMNDMVIKMAKSAKLTILDWHLDGKTSSDAEAIIKRIAENQSGMRWVIVYTQEKQIDTLPSYLAGILEGKWTTEAKFQQVEALSEGLAEMKRLRDRTLRVGSVFITFISKIVDPNQLLDMLGARLRKHYGQLSHVLLGLAADMEEGGFRVISQMAKPFELSVYLHALAEDLSEEQVAGFLFRLYAENAEPEDYTRAADELRRHRIGAAETAAALAKEDPGQSLELLEILKMARVNGLDQKEWLKSLSTISTATSGEQLQGLVDSVSAELRLDSREKKRGFQVFLEFMCAFAEWRSKHPEEPLAAFFKHANKQRTRFTRLLTFRSGAKGSLVKTGQIYRQDGRYLFCVNPFCDTANPENIKHLFTFLKGTVRAKDESPRQAIIEVQSSKSQHATFVPLEDDIRVEYVVWDFASAHTIHWPPELSVWIEGNCTAKDLELGKGVILPWLKDKSPRLKRVVYTIALEHSKEFADLVRKRIEVPDLDGTEPDIDDPRKVLSEELPAFVGCLKKEYAQQIVNAHTSYQSRAGVSELYYNSPKSEDILNIFYKMPNAAADMDEFREKYGLTSEQAATIRSHSSQRSSDWFKAKTEDVGTGYATELVALLSVLEPGEVNGDLNNKAHSSVTADRLKGVLSFLRERKVIPEAVAFLYRRMRGQAGSQPDDLIKALGVSRISDEDLLDAVATLVSTDLENAWLVAGAEARVDLEEGIRAQLRQQLKLRVEVDRLNAVIVSYLNKSTGEQTA